MCGISLQNQAKGAAIFNIFSCVIKLIGIILLFTSLDFDFGPIFYACVAFVFLDLAIGIVLWIGIKKECKLMCWIWLIFNSILFLALFGLSFLTQYLKIDGLKFIIEVVFMSTLGFMLDIVRRYLKEVEELEDEEPVRYEHDNNEGITSITVIQRRLYLI